MDLYLKESEDPRVINLALDGADCHISANRCHFSAGEFEMKIYIEDGKTVVNSTLPMHRVSLFTVDEENVVESKLGMSQQDPYYWRAEMGLSEALAQQPNGITMRVIAQIGKDNFISEFNAR